MKKLFYLIVTIAILGLIVSGCIPVVPPAEQSNIDNLTKSTTRDVPGIYSTIQAAINAANPGDTIIVAAGTYPESLTINIPDLTVQSTTGAENTVIDGGGTGSVVNINTTGVKVIGFWLKNASTGIILSNSGEVRDCTITNFSSYGLSLFNASDNLVTGCTISTGGMFGVFLYAYSNENTFQNNDISGTLFGFCFDGGNLNNILTGNNIHDNTYGLCGILADSGYGGVSTSINFNNIYDNTNYGVKNTGYQTVDATNNWWGATDGPSEVGPGNGDAVSTNVDYDPWLTSPYSLVMKVEIDIKPSSDPNNINLNSKGVVPVAVISTDNFDANDIDPDTVFFAGASPVRWTMEDVDGDGDVDLLFHFKTQELELDEDSTEATLTGETYGGNSIEGIDIVNIIPKV
jgi:parallel beta-helix repeat protein